MAGKHQRKSSNRKTQQKAKRCWRREYKLKNLANMPTKEIRTKKRKRNEGKEAAKLKRGDLVYVIGNDQSLTIGSLIQEVRGQMTESKPDKKEKLTKLQMAEIIARIETAQHPDRIVIPQDIMDIDELYSVEDQYEEVKKLIAEVSSNQNQQ